MPTASHNVSQFHIAAAQEQGATQRDIAAKVGKSVGWVIAWPTLRN
jgi:hypothetical protein